MEGYRYCYYFTSLTSKAARAKRFGNRPGRMDRDSMQRLSEQRAEVGSIACKEDTASEADGGGKDRPVLFRKRERDGQSRIDGMARRNVQLPRFGIQGIGTIRQLQSQVPPRFFHLIGIRPAFVPRTAEHS